MHKGIDKELFIKYLEIIGNGYVTGDFEPLFPYLATDCVWESQWRLIPETGKHEVVNYYRKKGEVLKESQTSLKYMIVQFIDNMNPVEMDAKINREVVREAKIGLFYEVGKLALFLAQELNNTTNAVILDIKINKEGLISRIDLCMPELFKFEKYAPYYEK